MPVLDVRGLTTHIHTPSGPLTLVRDVSFTLEAGQTLALVGESGSGKSVTALSLLRLLDPLSSPSYVGQVLLQGRDVLSLPSTQLQSLRGSAIGMVFQEPLSALNPVQRVGEQVAEAVRLHQPMPRRQAWQRAVELLERVHIPNAASRARDYPHQLSGGQRQRVVIAMALACRPKVLIADEPTTALDVHTQAQVLQLLQELQAQEGLALLLITHDLGVVAQMADHVAVMYAGRVVEQAPAAAFFQAPVHPYAKGLLDAVALEAVPPRQPLPEIAGVVPLLRDLPAGCAFAPRCARATAQCQQLPALQSTHSTGVVACWHPLPHVVHASSAAHAQPTWGVQPQQEAA